MRPTSLCAIASAQPATEVFEDSVGMADNGGQTVEELPSGVQTKTQSYTVAAGGGTSTVKLTGAYSNSLKGFFALRYFKFRGQIFLAAKLIGDPQSGSPLNAIGLRDGDIITRLDDIRVVNYQELDRHYDQTLVRFIRFRSDRISEDMIKITDFTFEQP